jgi:signal transduction histidine kinase
MSQELGRTADGESDDIVAAVEANPDQTRRIEALGLVSAGVAHEFSSLLTVMLGSLQQLRRQPLDARGDEQLDRAEWGARQTARLLRQFLSLARRQIGKPQLVNLNGAFGNASSIGGQALRPRARRHRPPTDRVRRVADCCEVPAGQRSGQRCSRADRLSA